MPVSAMKLITIKGSGTEYHLILFAFGGWEEFFVEKGFSTNLGYIAGVLLGPNSALLVDTTFGHGNYAVEKAGYPGGHDLACAWEYILKRFDVLPKRGVLVLEQSADELQYGFKVKEVIGL